MWLKVVLLHFRIFEKTQLESSTTCILNLLINIIIERGRYSSQELLSPNADYKRS